MTSTDSDKWTDELDNCPACGGRVLKAYGSRGKFRLVRCRNCGLVFVSNMPAHESLSNYYRNQPIECITAQESADRDKNFELLEIIRSLHLPGNSVLDIGCGSGHFLTAARNFGFQTMGIDASDERVRICKEKHGLNVIHGMFPSVALKDVQFDLVWASHIIEHTLNPSSFIKAVIASVRPGGLICILTPNAASPSFRIMRCNHRYVIPPEHLLYWSERSLDFLMTRMGLRKELGRTRGGEHELKEIAAFVLKGRFLRLPLSSPPDKPFVEGRGRALTGVYRAVVGVSQFVAPIAVWLGGSELVGIYRKV